MAVQGHQLGVAYTPASGRDVMHILWATPFNVKSAIATFSREVCTELSRRGHDVQILRTEGGSAAALPAIACDLPVLRPDTPIPADVDLIVINYGNHAPYHAGALALAASVPALAIFHDAEMRDYFGGMVHRYGTAVPLLPGSPKEALYDDHFDLVAAEARLVLQSLSGMAAGAIVHGSHYLPTVSESCPGRVELIPLCFPDIGAPEPGPRQPGPIRLTIFGVISRYKQPDRLFEAVALIQQEFGDIEVHLAGDIEPDYRATLVELARELHIAEPIFHGHLSDKALCETLTRSDATCCLRYPVTEGGSASLITALQHGRPLIVSNIASYALVPDGLVSKVPYGADVASLADALRAILADPARANARAIEARTWGRDNLSATAYVDRLEPLMSKALRILPALQACRQLASGICYPNGDVMMPALLDVVGAASDFLFPEE